MARKRTRLGVINDAERARRADQRQACEYFGGDYDGFGGCLITGRAKLDRLVEAARAHQGRARLAGVKLTPAEWLAAAILIPGIPPL